jgi:S1-C subfamily serine protease
VVTGGFPAPAPVTGPPYPGAVEQVSGPAEPISGWSPSSAPPSFPAPGFGPPPPPPGSHRSAVLLAVFAVVILLVIGVQTALLISLNNKLNTAGQQRTKDNAAAAQREDALSGRVKALEQQAASSLDSTAVAKAVLPSVFRVDAGEFSGTAFAISKPGAAASGGTDLLTNYHVVQSVYEGGKKSVSLQHDNQRNAATITRVNPGQDLALLHSTSTFPRLGAAGAQAPSGTPIIVIGAPLGLSQSVTSGIISAVRSDIPGESGKTFIQFSAPINPGNSGGPVVDAHKQVVGIASAKANGAEGIGLAIPIHVACRAFSIC